MHFLNLQCQLIRRSGFLKLYINFLYFLICVNLLKDDSPFKKAAINTWELGLFFLFSLAVSFSVVLILTKEGETHKQTNKGK
jgi:hypothetical protein